MSLVHLSLGQLLSSIQVSLVHLPLVQLALFQFARNRMPFPTTVTNFSGCVDGTHLKLTVPAEDRPTDMNRKGFTSINCTAVMYSRDRLGPTVTPQLARRVSLVDLVSSGSDIVYVV